MIHNVGFVVPILFIAMSVVTCQENFTSNAVVQLFREYIRINTSHPTPDLESAVTFWQAQAEELELGFVRYEYVTGWPVLVLTWEGTNSSLPSIMLNSHMDVVYADETQWTYPPFDAYMDSNNNIHGRGTQDMKCNGIWYLEAIRELKNQGITLERTVYMTLMPDEEIGGAYGMEQFVKSDEFTAMNVGLELDEAFAFPTVSVLLLYVDKTIWQFTVSCNANAVAASILANASTTSSGKCSELIEEIMAYRETQYSINNGDLMRAGEFTSINLTKMNGGTATNIVPAQLNVTFDMRIALNKTTEEMENLVNTWLTDAGPNVTVDYILKSNISVVTPLDETNPFWEPFSNVVTSLNYTLNPIVSPGASDARFVRLAGVNAFGFSPIPNTPTLAHAANEYINAQTLVDGVDVYVNILQAIGYSFDC